MIAAAAAAATRPVQRAGLALAAAGLILLTA